LILLKSYISIADSNSSHLTEENKRILENKRRVEITMKKGKRKRLRGEFNEYFFK
jgi:hypothetical protein